MADAKQRGFWGNLAAAWADKAAAKRAAKEANRDSAQYWRAVAETDAAQEQAAAAWAYQEAAPARAQMRVANGKVAAFLIAALSVPGSVMYFGPPAKDAMDAWADAQRDEARAELVKARAGAYEAASGVVLGQGPQDKVNDISNRLIDERPLNTP